jgi:hypothetical protein
MTLDELKENWRLYAVKLPDGTVVPLKERFVVCLGEYLDGLLFDPGGKQGAEVEFLKPDEEDNCYAWIDPDAEGEAQWMIQGKFVRLEEEA